MALTVSRRAMDNTQEVQLKPTMHCIDMFWFIRTVHAYIDPTFDIVKDAVAGLGS